MSTTGCKDITVDITDTAPQSISVDISGPQINYNVTAQGFVTKWGSILGELSAQTDLFQVLSGIGIQTLFYEESSQQLFITRGNSVSLSSLSDISLQTVLEYLSTNVVTISSLQVNENIELSGSLIASGSGIFGGNIDLSGSLIVGEDVTLDGTLNVGNSATIVGSLSVTGDAYIDGTLFTGATAIVFDQFLTVIGDNVNNNFEIQHNLETKDVHVVVKDSTTGILSYPSIQTLTPNKINVAFNFVPTPSAYDVSIFAGRPSNRISAYKIKLDVPERPIANTFYVTVSGSDENSGTDPNFSLKTIKKACQLAHNNRVLSKNNPNVKYTVFIGTGDYIEENPVYVPPNTSLIGDNLRRVSIFPKNKQYDILWCDNSVYVWGFTFRGHLEPAAATAFPNLRNPTLSAIALSALEIPFVSGTTYKWRRPYIVTSPYIQGCSSITSGVNGVSAGCGMRVDGSLAEGFLRSMVLDSYTQFNEGGKGIHITNNGYAQLVSIFTICCTEGVRCDNGGTCSINNSNCAFGLSGIVADGKSVTPVLTGVLVNNPFRSDQVIVTNIQGMDIFPDSDYYPSVLFSPIGLDTRKIAYTPYNGLVFTIGNDSTIYSIRGNPELSGGTTNTYSLFVPENIRANYIPGTPVNFFIRSTITTSSHTFEYIGSGVTLRTAVPALGGITTPETEAVAINGGAVFFTSTNQAGDFRVGDEFTIVQETATIEGDTFKRSILTLVTPLNLALE